MWSVTSANLAKKKMKNILHNMRHTAKKHMTNRHGRSNKKRMNRLVKSVNLSRKKIKKETS